MDGERKINLGEGVPLNATGAANIFLNAKTKSHTRDGTVIHVNTGTEKPADVGVHINTTLSIASSKKIRLLFVLNFLLSVLCMVISCSIAFYYWNEIMSMRRQLDSMKDQFFIQNVNSKKIEASPLVSEKRSHHKEREGRMDFGSKFELSQNARKYYVEDLGEDMVFVDSTKKTTSTEKIPVYDLSILKKDPLIVHFKGALKEVVIGKETDSLVGPWVRDTEVSSKNSEGKIELDASNKFVTIKEDGLYLVYAQVVYVTHSPSCFFIFARQTGNPPRPLATCATGDDSSGRPLEKSQISCSVQTVARLYRGDVVNIAQREFNRTLWLGPGYSHFGFVKLSS